jgi:hypothetical protein
MRENGKSSLLIGALCCAGSWPCEPMSGQWIVNVSEHNLVAEPPLNSNRCRVEDPAERTLEVRENNNLNRRTSAARKDSGLKDSLPIAFVLRLLVPRLDGLRSGRKELSMYQGGSDSQGSETQYAVYDFFESISHALLLWRCFWA